MHLKTCCQNAEIKLAEVQTRNFDAFFLIKSETGDEAKSF